MLAKGSIIPPSVIYHICYTHAELFLPATGTMVSPFGYLHFHCTWMEVFFAFCINWLLR